MSGRRGMPRVLPTPVSHVWHGTTSIAVVIVIITAFLFVWARQNVRDASECFRGACFDDMSLPLPTLPSLRMFLSWGSLLWHGTVNVLYVYRTRRCRLGIGCLAFRPRSKTYGVRLSPKLHLSVGAVRRRDTRHTSRPLAEFRKIDRYANP